MNLVTALLLASLCAAAPAPGGEKADPSREQARTLLQEGNKLLDQGQYLDALDRFQAAYRAFPSPKLHFNIAQTLNELGRSLDALDHYEQYVRAVPEADQPDLVRAARQQIVALQGRISTVQVRSNVSEALISADGVEVGRTPLLSPLRFMPGPHVLVASKAGYERAVADLKLEAGAAAVHSFDLKTEEEAVATRQAVQAAESRRLAAQEQLLANRREAFQVQQGRQRSFLAAGWACVGVGLAAAAAAAVLGGLAASDAQAVEQASPGVPWKDVQANYDRAGQLQTAAWATGAAAGALAVTGAVLLGGFGYRELPPPPQAGAAAAPPLRFGIGFGPGAARVQVAGSF